MTHEQAYILIQKVTANDWKIRKETFWELINISNGLLVDRNLQKDYFNTERQQISNLLTQKIIMHGASIFKLLEGVDFPIKKGRTAKIVDPFSMKVLFRGLLEGYLTLNHINSSDTEYENEIRFKIWLQFGLVQRGKMNVVFYSQEATNQLALERKQIQELINDIKASEFYNSMDNKKQITFVDQIRKDWKFGSKRNTYVKYSWQDLVENSGLNKQVFKDTYNFLSWFAHSTSISLFQLRDFYKEDRTLQETILIMMETSIIIALACTDLIKIDNELKNQYYLLTQYEKDLINIYNYVFRSNEYTIERIKE